MNTSARVVLFVTAISAVAHADVSSVAVERLAPSAGYARSNRDTRRDVSRAFLSHHADAYDFLVVFPAFPVDFADPAEPLVETLGLHHRVRNDVSGLGIPVSDDGTSFGSARRLKAFIDVKALDESAPDVQRSVGIVAHELAHQFGASVRFRDPLTGQPSSDLVTPGQHWSYFFDSEGDVLLGNDWSSADGGFVTGPGRVRYSKLLRYLMGFLPSTAVPPMTLVRPTSSSATATSLPVEGVFTAGAATQVTVNDIIAVEGARVPSSANAQRVFRAAFVVLLPNGGTPTPAQLAHVDAVRRAMGPQFFQMTDGQGTLETELVESPVSANQYQGLQAGVDYLLSRQTDAGSWADSPQSAVRDTEAALAALQLFQDSPAVAAARLRADAFLTGLAPTNADDAARRVRALRSLDALRAVDGRLLSFRGPLPGASLTRGYSVSPIDTALALGARVMVGSVSAQDADWQRLRAFSPDAGGWPLTVSGPPRIESTVEALFALHRLQSRQASDESLATQGFQFLRSVRRSSGAFADDSESPARTCQVVDVMSEWGRLTSTEGDAARQFLVARQQFNGSWSDTVFDTAHAVFSLSRTLAPNLSISSVDATASQSAVLEGQPLTLAVTVHNTGSATSEATTIRVTTSTGLVVASGVLVPSVGAGAQQTVTVPINTTGAGGSTSLFVFVDPDGRAGETRRDDNQAAVAVAVLTTPSTAELFPVVGSLTVSPSAIATLPETARVSLFVANGGLTGATQVPVSVMVNGSAVASTLVDVAALSNQAVTLEWPILQATAGVSFTVVVDANNVVPEAIETNNAVTGVIPFQLSTRAALVSVSAASPSVAQGRDVSLFFVIQNSGTLPISGGQVQVAVKDASGATVATLTPAAVAIPAGATGSASAAWRATRSGVLSFAAQLVVPFDASTGDDTQTVTVTVTPATEPNLHVAVSDVVASPSPVLALQAADVAATVTNDGVSATGPFVVVLRNLTTSQQLLRSTVPSLAPGASTTLHASFTPQDSAAQRISWEVDVDGAVQEFDESDNAVVAAFNPLSAADLFVSAASLALSPAFPRTGDTTTVTATVANRGGQASTPTQAELFLGSPAGVRLGVFALPAVGAGADAVVSFSWSATGVAPVLVLVVNGSHAALESNYGNNQAQRAIAFQSSALSVTERFISPNGDGVQESTTIQYSLGTVTAASVLISTPAGEVVRHLDAGVGQAGEVVWDGRTEAGASVADGTYDIRVEGGETSPSGVSVVVDTNNTRLSSLDGGQYLLAESIGRGVGIPAILDNTPGADSRFRHIQFRDPSSRVGAITQPTTILPTGEFVFVGAKGEGQCGLFGRNPFDEVARLISPASWPCSWAVGGFGQPYGEQVFDDPFHIFLKPRTVTANMPEAIVALDATHLGLVRYTRTPFETSVRPPSVPNNFLFDFFGTATRSRDLRVLDLLSGSERIVQSLPLYVDGLEYVCFGQSFGCASPHQQGPGGGFRAIYGGGVGSSGVAFAPLPPPQGLFIQDFSLIHHLIRLDGGVTSLPSQTPAFSFHFENSGYSYVLDGGLISASSFDSSASLRASLNGLTLSGVTSSPTGLDYVGVTGPPTASGVLAVSNGGVTSQLSAVRAFRLTVSHSGSELAYNDGNRAIHVLDVATGRDFTVPEAFYGGSATPRWSPNNQVLLLDETVVSTTANLAASISASRSPFGGLTFRGIAQDINFARYTISARRHGEAGPASLVVSSTTPVVRGVLGGWLPPNVGQYDIELTVYDLAGNSKSVSTTAIWSLAQSLVSFQTTPADFSPNGDGTLDDVTVRYTTQAPVSLSVTVTGSDGASVRNFSRTHLDPGSYQLSWDGRDNVGLVAPDGTYSVASESFSNQVTVDTLPPSVALQLLGIKAATINAVDGFGERRSVPTLSVAASYLADDRHLGSWVVEAAPTGTVDFRSIRSGTAGVSVPADSLLASQVRGASVQLRAADVAGNIASTASVSVPEVLRVLGVGSAQLIAPSRGELHLDGAVLPRVDMLDTHGTTPSFVPQRWAFWLGTTVGPQLTSYVLAWRPRGVPAAWTLSPLDVRAETLVEWNAESLPDAAVEVEIRATDATGRQFVAPFTFNSGVRAGALTSCLAPVPSNPESPRVSLVIARQTPNEVLYLPTGAAVDVIAEGETLPETQWNIPPTATYLEDDSPGVAVPAALFAVVGANTSLLRSCKYKLKTRGLLNTGEAIRAEGTINVCRLSASGVRAVDGQLVATLHSSFRETPTAVETLVRDGAAWRSIQRQPGFVGDFQQTAALGAIRACGSLPVRWVATFADGSTVDSQATDQLSCSGQGPALQVPCGTLLVGLGFAPTPSHVCNQPVDSPSVRIQASAGAGSSIVGLRAWLKRVDGVRVEELPVSGATAGASVVANALVPAASYASGLYRVEAESRDALGSIQTAVGPPQGFFLGTQGTGVSAAPPVQVCAAAVGGRVRVALGPVSASSTAGVSDVVALWGSSGIAVDEFQEQLLASYSPTKTFVAIPNASLDITSLPTSETTLVVALGARDTTGFLACEYRSVQVTRGPSLSDVVAPVVVSPDGDGAGDIAHVSFGLGAPASVTFTTRRANGTTRSLSSTSLQAGPHQVALDFAGEPQGPAELLIEATSSCGGPARTTVLITVDTLAPTARLDAPEAGEVTAGIVPILGEASDATIDGYELSYGEGAAPSNWVPFANVTGPRQGLLGQWDASGLASGTYSLRLVVRDRAGHFTEALKTVTLVGGVALDAGATVDAGLALRQVVASESAISPNGDARKDTLTVSGVLTRAAAVQLSLTGDAGVVVATLTPPQALSAGAFSVTVPAAAWTASDGRYGVLVRAVDGADMAEVSVSVELDRVAPTVAIQAPDAGAIVAAPLMPRVQVASASSWSVAALGGEGVSTSVASGVGDIEGPVGPAVLDDGTYELVLSAEDVAGNHARVISAVTLDATPPRIDFTTPSEGAALAAGSVVSLSAVVDDATPVSVDFFVTRNSVRRSLVLSSSTTTSFVALWDTAADGIGRAELEVVARDAAGNSASATHVVSLIEAPVVTLTQPTGTVSQHLLAFVGSVESAAPAEWLLEAAEGTDAVPDDDGFSLLAFGHSPLSGAIPVSGPALPPGTYWVRLRATVGAVSSSAQNRIVVLEGVLPPSQVLAEATGDAGVHVSWSASSSSGVASYAVRRSYAGGASIEVGTTTSTSFDDADLAPGLYAYSIVSRRADGVSSQPSLSATVDVVGVPPAAPANVTATRVGPRGVQVAWGAGATSTQLSYEVRRRSGNGALLSIANGLHTTTFDDATLADGTYRYVVIATSIYGLTSPPSAEVEVTIDNTPPLASLSRPEEAAYVSGLVSVVGTAAGSQFQRYELAVAQGAGAFQVVTAGTAAVTAGSLGVLNVSAWPDAAAGTLRLTVSNTRGESQQVTRSFTVDSQAPTAPVLTSTTAVGSHVVVAWQASLSTDVVGYVVFRDGAVAAAPSGTSVGDLTPYAVSILSFEQDVVDGTHTYFVVALDRAGNVSVGSNSRSVTVETNAPSAVLESPADRTVLSAPTLVVASSTQEDVAAIDFQVRTSTQSSFVTVASVATAPFSVTLNPAVYGVDALELRAVARDFSGNVGAPSPTRVVFVQSEPQPFVAHTHTEAEDITLSWTQPAGALPFFLVGIRSGESVLWQNTPLGSVGTVTASADLPAAEQVLNGGRWAASGPGSFWQWLFGRQLVATGIGAVPEFGVALEVRQAGFWRPMSEVQFPAILDGVRVHGDGDVGLYNLSVGLYEPMLSSSTTVLRGPGSYQLLVQSFGSFEPGRLAETTAVVAQPSVVVEATRAAFKVHGTRAFPGSTVDVGLVAGTTDTHQLVAADADGVFEVAFSPVAGWYRVMAVSIDGSGNRSLPGLVAALAQPSIDAVVTLSAGPVSGRSVPLNIAVTGDQTGVQSFLATRRGPNGVDEIGVSPGVGVTDTIPASAGFGVFTYTVQAVGFDGSRGAPSNAVRVEVQSALAAPTGLTGVLNGSTVALAWLPVDGAAAYRVERAAVPGDFAAVGADVLLVSFEDVLATRPQTLTLQYQVRAVDAEGNVGPQSDAVAVPLSPVLAPQAPFIALTTPPLTNVPTAGVQVQSWLSLPAEFERDGVPYVALSDAGASVFAHSAPMPSPAWYPATSPTGPVVFSVGSNWRAQGLSPVAAFADSANQCIRVLPGDVCVRSFSDGVFFDGAVPSGLFALSPHGEFLAAVFRGLYPLEWSVRVVDLRDPYGPQQVFALASEPSALTFRTNSNFTPGVFDSTWVAFVAEPTFDSTTVVRALTSAGLTSSVATPQPGSVRELVATDDAVFALWDDDSGSMTVRSAGTTSASWTQLISAPQLRGVVVSPSYVAAVAPHTVDADVIVVPADGTGSPWTQSVDQSSVIGFLQPDVIAAVGLQSLSRLDVVTHTTQSLPFAPSEALTDVARITFDGATVIAHKAGFGGGVRTALYAVDVEVPLLPGANNFFARHIGAQGVLGDASNSLTVETTADGEDVSIDSLSLPQGSLVQEGVVTLHVGVRSRHARIGPISLHVTASPESGPSRETTVTMNFIPELSTTDVSLDLTGLTGAVGITAVVDADEVVDDFNRRNNTAVLDVLVGPSGGLSVLLSTTAPSRSEVFANVTLFNPSVRRSNLTLQTTLQTATGTVLSAADLVAVPVLAAQSTRSEVVVVSTAAVPAGDYVVVAELRQYGNLLYRTSAPVHVELSAVATVGLSSAKALYDLNDSIQLVASVTNTAIDALNGEVVVSVQGQGGFSLTQRRTVSVSPEGTASVGFVIAAGAIPQGHYSVTTSLRAGSLVVGAPTASFEVDASARVAAELELVGATSSPPIVAEGSAFTVRTTIHNLAVASTVSVGVYSLAGDLVQGFSRLLQPQTSQVYVQALSGVSPAGRYSLVVMNDDTATSLATTQLIVRDATGPSLDVLSPAQSELVGAPLQVHVRARDVNGVAAVGVSVDGAPSVALELVDGFVNDGEWSGAVSGLADGPHALFFSAVDTGGAPSPGASVQVTTDSTPPILVLAGVTPGGRYNAPVVPSVTATDASGTPDVRVSLNGAAFASGTPLPEGEYLLSANATDAVGNVASLEARFSVDTQEPIVLLAAPAEGAAVTGPVSLTYSASDVHLATVAATLNGSPLSAQSSVSVLGPAVVVVTATDTFGNVSVATRHFSIVADALSLQLTGVTSGQVTRGPVVVAALVSGATQATATLDGNTYVLGSPIVSEGPHVVVAQATGPTGAVVSATATFAIDTTSPRVEVDAPANGAVVAQPVAFSWAADDAHLASVSATLDTGPVAQSVVVEGEGPHSYVIEALDLAGNSTVRSGSFVIDTIAPVLSVTGVADGGLYGAPVAVSVVVTDANPGALVLTLDALPFVSGATVSAEGPHFLEASAVDAAGNRSSTSVNFELDTRAPVLTLAGVAHGDVVSHAVTLTYSAVDAHLASVSSTVDGVAFVSGDSVSSPGSHLWRVEASDVLGHTSFEERSFTITVNAPSIAITGVTDGLVTNVPVTPVVTVSGATVVQVLLDGAPFTSGTTVSGEGVHDLQVQALNGAAAATATLQFAIDTTPPVLAVMGVTEGQRTQGPVVVQFAVSDAHLASVLGLVNGVAVVSGVSVSVEGDYTFELVGTDVVGNSSTLVRHFTVDRTPPVITIAGVTDGQVSNAASLTPVFSASDAATVSATLDGAPFVSGTTVFAEGAHVLRVVAADVAGNVAQRQAQFVLDRIAPSITVTGTANGATVSSSVSLAVQVVDATATTTVVTLDGQPVGLNVSVTTEGPHDLLVQATDAAGNLSNKSVHFVIDRIAPTLTLSGVSNGAVVHGPVTLTATTSDATSVVVTATVNGSTVTLPATFSVDADYVWVVGAVDAAGNVTSQTRSFAIDTIAPVITVSGVTEGQTVSGGAAVTFATTDAHLASTVATLDGVAFVSGSAVTVNGAHTLVVTATDAAGNASTLTRHFTVVTQAGSTCRSVVLVAAKKHAPATFYDGTASFAQPLRFQLPAAIPVTVGAAFSGAELELSWTLQGGASGLCQYRGGTSSYGLLSCVPALAAGDLVTATSVSMRVVRGSTSTARTAVSVTLNEVAPCAGSNPIPNNQYAVCSFGTVSIDGSSRVAGSVGAHGAATLTGSSRIEDVLVAGGNVSLAGSSRVAVATYYAGTLTQTGSSSAGVQRYTTPAPAPCECGFDAPAKLVEVAAANNNNALLADPAWAPYLAGGALVINSSANLTLPGGRYFFSSLTLSGSSDLSVSGSTPAEIYVAGNVTIAGSSKLNWSGTAPVLIVSGASNGAGTNVSIGSSSKAFATILAPNAAVNLTGSVTLKGSVVGLTTTMTGSTQFTRYPGPRSLPPPLTCTGGAP